MVAGSTHLIFHPMKQNKNQIQQGDVMIALIDKLPANCKRLRTDKRGVVLAEGEHTGHYHGSDERGLALMESPDGKRFVVNETDEQRRFTHQEHKPVTIPPHSIAQIGIVREKDWFQDMVRNVID
jgi:hypothetical protein